MAPSQDRGAGALRGLDAGALVLHGAQRAGPGGGTRPPAAQGPRPPALGQCRTRRAGAPAVARAPELELSAPPGQSGRGGGRAAGAGAAALVLDPATLPGGPGAPAPPAPAGGQAWRGRAPGRSGSRAPRAAQLRGRVRRRPLAPRLPPCLAQDPDRRRLLGAADPARCPRRPLAPRLPRPVVLGRDRPDPGPRPDPGDPEARPAARPAVRQRLCDACRRDPRGARPPGHRAPDDAAVFARAERQAGGAVGAGRRPADRHAGGRARPVAGALERGHPGVGGDRVPPHAALRDSPDAARALARRPGRHPAVPRGRRAAPGLHHLPAPHPAT